MARNGRIQCSYKLATSTLLAHFKHYMRRLKVRIASQYYIISFIAYTKYKLTPYDLPNKNQKLNDEKSILRNSCYTTVV